jgi:hypothetical protein
MSSRTLSVVLFCIIASILIIYASAEQQGDQDLKEHGGWFLRDVRNVRNQRGRQPPKRLHRPHHQHHGQQQRPVFYPKPQHRLQPVQHHPKPTHQSSNWYVEEADRNGYAAILG